MELIMSNQRPIDVLLEKISNDHPAPTPIKKEKLCNSNIAERIPPAKISLSELMSPSINKRKLTNSNIAHTTKLANTLTIIENDLDCPPVYSGTIRTDHQAKVLAYNFLLDLNEEGSYAELPVDTDQETYSMLQKIEEMDGIQSGVLLFLIYSKHNLYDKKAFQCLMSQNHHDMLLHATKSLPLDDLMNTALEQYINCVNSFAGEDSDSTPE
jgi:hypothetical protein